MTQEFYIDLQSLISECEQHPYKSTYPIEFGNGWEGRISKEHLGAWTNEDYDTLFNNKDEKVTAMCNKSRLDCFVYCDGNGYIYLAFY